MSLLSAIRLVRGQIQRHKDLVPLFGAYGIATCLSAAIMVYTSVGKADVSWNRWGNPDPYARLNWEKNEQKLVMGVPSEKENYKRDDQLLAIRKQIYADGDYVRVVHH